MVYPDGRGIRDNTVMVCRPRDTFSIGRGFYNLFISIYLFVAAVKMNKCLNNKPNVWIVGLFCTERVS